MAELGVPAVPVLTDHDAPVMARDGTRLRADVYRAAEGGPFPVLLIRNPYGEQLMRAASPVIPAIDAGFAVVVQHCRGTGTSDGEFVTFENEAADGADAIEWCARQPWCDGSVAMLGPSYLGMVQLAAATAVPRPAALKGMVLIVTPADYHWGLAYRQGTDHPRTGLPVHDRPHRDQPGLQGGPPGPGRRGQLELPVLRPEPG